VASAQVLLACRWHVFSGHSIEERLQRAFDSFHSWCIAEKKKSSINKFELKTFKMASLLGSSDYTLKRIHACFLRHCIQTWIWRLKVWPGGCGKAYDTTLLSRWLLSVVNAGELRAGHDSQQHMFFFSKHSYMHACMSFFI